MINSFYDSKDDLLQEVMRTQEMINHIDEQKREAKMRIRERANETIEERKCRTKREISFLKADYMKYDDIIQRIKNCDDAEEVRILLNML